MTLNEQREQGYMDAQSVYEALRRIPMQMRGANEYEKGWNAFVEEVREAAEEKPRKMTRNERLQEMADHGIDTWEDYRGEK